nr:MAG TPA: hypothetical protein [Caudoviricetes sp.]
MIAICCRNIAHVPTWYYVTFYHVITHFLAWYRGFNDFFLSSKF